jgi:transcription initiation factor TFIIB
MLAKCILCNGEKTFADESTGEVICNNCGVVVEENIEISATPRTFSKEEFETRSRTGAPNSLTRHDMGLSTIISRFDRDASGNGLNANMKTIMDRLRTWDHRTQVSRPRDRNLVKASNELDRLRHKLSLTDAVMEKAAYIYRKAQARKLVRGRTILALTAASVYAACRELGVHRSLKEIANASNVKFKEISRSYKLLLEALEIDVSIPDPTKAIVKVGSSLGLSEKTVREALMVLDEIRKHGSTAGKEPTGLAGTLLYLMSLKNGDKVTQKEISEAAGVTEVTIRNRAREIKEKHQDLFQL